MQAPIPPVTSRDNTVQFTEISASRGRLYALDTAGKIWIYSCTSSYSGTWEWHRIPSPERK